MLHSPWTSVLVGRGVGTWRVGNAFGDLDDFDECRFVYVVVTTGARWVGLLTCLAEALDTAVALADARRPRSEALIVLHEVLALHYANDSHQGRVLVAGDARAV